MSKKIVTIVAIVSIVAVMAVMFAGCASIYQKNLENEGFTVVKYTKADAEEKFPALKDYELDTKYMVYGNKNVVENVLIIGTKAEIDKETKEKLQKSFKGIIDFQADAILIGTPGAIKTAKGTK